MTRFAASCIAAVLLGGLPAAGVNAHADEGSDRAAGAALAQELCSACHIVAEGQAGPMPDAVPPFPVIANRPGRTIGYLQAYLSEPTPPMPHVPLS